MEDDTIQLVIEELRIKGADKDETLRYIEIVNALLKVGGLSGVKNGSTIIHFDNNGTFRGVQLDYWPWRRRKSL